MNALPVPAAYRGVTPYLIVRGGARALEFYRAAFGAVETMHIDGPDGRIGHAEMSLGAGAFMLADEYPEMNIRGPESLGGTSVSLMFYVDDVDARFAQVLAAGGKVMKPLQDQFYGDRSGTLTDPFGHVWTIATHIEEVTPEEMGRRAAEAMKGGCVDEGK